jgi:alanine-glyoxylate transaminase / serine-glyoxylate transaminase / serine-pyruvate transaminase
MKTGINHLYIPGPTNVPEVVRQAMNVPMQDMRAHDFGAQWLSLFTDLKAIMRTMDGTAMLLPGSGTAAWEAAMTNTLNPGDRVLMARHGQFSTLWVEMAQRLGLDVVVVDAEWGTGTPVAEFARHLAADKDGLIKGVFATHNETATGVTSDIAAVRAAMNASFHTALLFVDAVSSFGSIDVRMDDWGVDLLVAGSQKGLMCPAGLGVLGISPKAMAASKTATLRRAYFEFKDMVAMNAGGYFPYTPPTQLLHGMRAALDRINAEGLDNVLARHARLATGVRRAVAAWGLDLVAQHPIQYSNTVSAIRVPEGVDARDVIRIAYDRYATSFGSGLSQLAGKVFRIGHLGDLNEGMVLTALCVAEMALSEAGVTIRFGSGVAAAQAWFSTGQHLSETPAVAAA